MGWLDRLFWSPDSDEDDYETEEKTEEFCLRETFVRKTVEFQFVRGGSTTVTYDVFDGKRSDDDYSGWPRSFEDGKWITSRGDHRVERFMQFSGEAQVGKRGDDWEDYVRLRGEATGDEVTTMNVAARHVEMERQMEVIIPCERTVRVRTDTGEQTYEGVPSRRNHDATYAAHEVDDGAE